MKKTILSLLAFVIIISMIGCSNIQSILGNSTQAYGEYVSSLLDAKLKGDYDKYMELTDSDEQTIKALHAESMRAFADSFIELYGIKTTSDDIYDRMLDIVTELCSKTSYRTSDAQNVDGEYLVTVTIIPLDYILVTKEAYNSFIEEWINRYEGGEFTNLSTQEYDLQFDEEIMDLLEKSLERTSEQQSIIEEVAIEFTEDTYYVAEGDFMDIQMALFAR